MIAQIDTIREYGKQGKIGINVVGSDDCDYPAFAHSVQDAVDWLKKFPLYQDAIFDHLSDGRVMVWTKWAERNSIYKLLIDDDHKDAGFERTFVAIYPRNTIYENTGMEGYKAA